MRLGLCHSHVKELQRDHVCTNNVDSAKQSAANVQQFGLICTGSHTDTFEGLQKGLLNAKHISFQFHKYVKKGCKWNLEMES